MSKELEAHIEELEAFVHDRYNLLVKDYMRLRTEMDVMKSALGWEQEGSKVCLTHFETDNGGYYSRGKKFILEEE